MRVHKAQGIYTRKILVIIYVDVVFITSNIL